MCRRRSSGGSSQQSAQGHPRAHTTPSALAGFRTRPIRGPVRPLSTLCEIRNVPGLPRMIPADVPVSSPSTVRPLRICRGCDTPGFVGWQAEVHVPFTRRRILRFLAVRRHAGCHHGRHRELRHDAGQGVGRRPGVRPGAAGPILRFPLRAGARRCGPRRGQVRPGTVGCFRWTLAGSTWQ